MDSETRNTPLEVCDGESRPQIGTPAGGDASDALTMQVMALEKSVHRLRITLYCGLALVLICGVLAGEWLFKHTVRRVDEASGSMQTQIDQRAKASRLNIEDDLNEIRRQLKANGGAVSPARESATSSKDMPRSKD
jgi:hypothetical protein